MKTTSRSVLRAAHRRARAWKRSGAHPSADRGAPTAPVVIDVDSLRRLVAMSANIAAGFAACAKHARSAAASETATALSATHADLASELAALLASFGAPAARRVATGERLRWEWLASTGGLVDHAPEKRVLAECVRLQREAVDLTLTLRRAATGPLAAKLRHLALAGEEARSEAERLLGTLALADPRLAFARG